jgi:hypothetical protein
MNEAKTLSPLSHRHANEHRTTTRVLFALCLVK